MKLIQLAAVATVVGIAVPFAATRGATFTTPERIDVFNNWDTDTGTATTTTSFTSGSRNNGKGVPTFGFENNWRHQPPNSGTTDIYLEFHPTATLPKIGRFHWGYKNADHSTNNFVLSNEDGVLADETHAGTSWGDSTHGDSRLTAVDITFNTPVSPNELRYDSTISKHQVAGDGKSTTHGHQTRRFRALAAAGQSVQIEDSGYNIFYDEAISSYARDNATKSPAVSSGMINSWFDGDLHTMKKQTRSDESQTDWVILPFEESWRFVGARSVLWDTRRIWKNLKLEVSADGENDWVQVFYKEEWQMEASVDAGYMPFGTGDGSATEATGQFVRMSWQAAPQKDFGNFEQVELKDLELFAAVIPEPGDRKSVV